MNNKSDKYVLIYSPDGQMAPTSVVQEVRRFQDMVGVGGWQF